MVHYTSHKKAVDYCIDVVHYVYLWVCTYIEVYALAQSVQGTYVHSVKYLLYHRRIFFTTAKCTSGDVRLRLNTIVPESYELIDDELARGRVEVCVEDKFGTVCDDFWDHTDASVVCNQLGFSPNGECGKTVYTPAATYITFLAPYHLSLYYYTLYIVCLLLIYTVNIMEIIILYCFELLRCNWWRGVIWR